MGFKNLYGIEIQQEAIRQAKISVKNLHIVCGSALNIPFKDRQFDLVFTSGVLIHIHPKNCVIVLKEIYRCAKKFIWGFEYFSPQLQEIVYRKYKEVLWKSDFCKLLLETFPDLKLIKEEKIK